MLPRLAGIFGWREREIITAKISACRMKQNADLGRRVLLLTVLPVTLLILQVLQAHTAPTLTVLQDIPVLVQAIWQVCSVQAAISCTTILPTPPFTATAK